MTDNDVSILPPPSPDHRRIAAGQFERANQVIATGNFDYGIQLLLACCKLDPANLIYRRALRQTEKAKYKNNLHGSRLAVVSTSATKARVKAAKRGRDYLKVFELAEDVLAKNPWDTGVQLDMAEAAAAIGLLDLAVWTLEQARQKDPKDFSVNRSLAQLYEKRGNFTHAIALWDLIRQTHPRDQEAAQKAKDLAAHDTIARGQYEKATLGETAETATEEAEGEPPAAQQPVPNKPANDRVSQEAAVLLARVEADPTNVNACLQLARVYRRAAQFDQARTVLEQGLGPTGNDFELAAELAEVAIEPFRRNLTLTEEQLRSRPKDEELRKIRGRLLREINTRETDLYRMKADRYPTEKVHRLELGVRLLRARQLDEAILELQAARSDPRFQGKALLHLGYCFKQRNNWRLAQRNFDEALKQVNPADTELRKEILFQLAQGNAEAGDLAQALETGYELANLDFAYHNIGRLLDDWQARLDGGTRTVGSDAGTEE